MLKSLFFLATIVLTLMTNRFAYGQNAFQVEIMEGTPMADAVSADFAYQFSDQGYRVKSEAGRTVVELWLSKQWEIEADFQATEQRLYPFIPGQLIGLLHLSRKGSEFRKQEVTSGWYTLRFGLQPVDGNHEGTSVTRDFLLMIGIERDEVTKKWSEKDLFVASSESIGAAHPSMLSLQRADKSAKVTIRHDSEKDWWILHGLGNRFSAGKLEAMPLDIVVVGHAPE